MGYCWSPFLHFLNLADGDHSLNQAQFTEDCAHQKHKEVFIMTDYQMRNHRNYEALRALVAFFLLLFVLAACLDVGYLGAKRYNLQEGLEVAASTGVMGLPNPHMARSLVLNVANSQGIPLQPYDVLIDPGHKWVQIDMRDYYETMYLQYIGIRRIPIDVHVFDF